MKTQMTSSSISFKKVLPAERYLRASANEPAINDAELTRIRAAIARAEKAESELAAEREKVRVLREENTWQDKTTAPIERTRVLATHLGVYQPCVGSIHDSRFYPDGQYGAEPFTHWMPLPTFAAMKEDSK